MWITYFILDIIIPLVMLIAGVLSAKKPPKNINALGRLQNRTLAEK